MARQAIIVSGINHVPNMSVAQNPITEVDMLKVFSYGGGVQSTAALVLAAQGKIDYQTFLFCNVGDDSEHPATLAYVRDVAMPYAAANDIELIKLHNTRFGEPETLYQRLTRPGSRSIGIPVRMSNGAPGNRSCTFDFKINVVARWLRSHGATKNNPATVALGISLDEFQRMRSDSGIAYEKLTYPLVDMRLDRQDCTNIIAHAGLSVPPKSSCWYCPYHSLRVWQEMRQKEPALFEKAVALEQLINDRRATLGKDQVWLTDKLKPLAQATTELEQGSLFDDDVCESGYCMV